MFRLIDKWFLAMVFCLVIMASLLLPGCHPDYDVDLPNGYLLVRSNSYDIAIFGPKGLGLHRVIPPLIVSIGVKDEFVFGIVADPSEPSFQEKTERAIAERAIREKARGYFLLNTKTHKVQVGLTKEAWLAALEKNGLQGEPKMRKPSRWLG